MIIENPYMFTFYDYPQEERKSTNTINRIEDIKLNESSN